MVTSNLTLYAKWEQIVYIITDGDGQEAKQSELGDMEFTINGAFSLFGTVYVDDNLVSDDNYTAHTGSTVITFKQAYLSTLSVGTHTLKVVYNDGGVATGTFTILGNDPAPAPDPAPTPDEPVINPSTGDNIGTYILLLELSIIGILVVLIAKKKKMIKE